MSEERLKEIKHSLDFQEIMLISEIETYDADLEGVEELLKEEKDLYNEVIRLQQENKQLKEVINKANEFIRKHTKIIPFDEFGEGGGLELVDYDIADLLKILEVKDEYRRN